MNALADQLEERAAGTEVARLSQEETVLQAIERQQSQIALALPPGYTPERFTRTVMTAIKQTPDLQLCTAASMLGAVMLSAQLGLEPGPLGHCYLVPFRDHGVLKVTFITGYKGLVDLAYRSPRVESVVARSVHEGDEFSFEYGDDERIVHRPARGARGQSFAYYTVVRLVGGGRVRWVMYREEIEERRKRSKTPNKGPWVTDYDAMARKTVIRAMAPYLPLSPEVATAFEQDERVQATFDPDAQDVLTITEQPYDEDPGDVQALSAGADNPPSPSVPEIEAGELEPGGVRLPGQPEDDGNKNDHAVGAREASGSSSPAGSQDSVAVSPAPSVGTGEEAGDAGSMPEPPSEVDPSSVPDVPLDPYDTFTAAELAQECVSRGLSNSGTKTLMIERLREFDQRPM